MPSSFAAGRKRPLSLIGAIAVLGLLSPFSRAETPRPEIRDGDRIVLIGGTFIERDQYHGYLETILTTRLPDRNFTFRNLGWSGDTVTGISRARFGPVAEGYQHLIDHVTALKPTLLIVSYGANEAFEGEAGLPQFRDSLNTLLDTLTGSTHARIVLLSPIKAEKKPAPLPDPAKHNADLKLYGEALRDIANQRNMSFVDLYNLVPMNDDAEVPMTDNGIHLTAYGYWKVGEILAKELGAPMDSPDRGWTVDLLQDGNVVKTTDASVSDVKASDGGLRFKVTPEFLALPKAPEVSASDHKPASSTAKPSGQVSFLRLAKGKYVLDVDGKKVESYPGTTSLFSIYDDDPKQVEEVRTLINAKNRQYFYRWRPQNETYLFGFRKHEQGQNAREIPLFDPIVAELEGKIASLRKPKPHTYELIREGEVAR